MKHKNHPNMKVIWYEDLVANFDEEVKGLSEFTGFKLSDDQMAVIISSNFYLIKDLKILNLIYYS